MSSSMRKTRKVAEVKRLLKPKAAKAHAEQTLVPKGGIGKGGGGVQKKKGRRDKDKPMVRHVEKASSALFFKYNEALGPPYRVLADTNFINFSIKNKLDMVQAAEDCLCAKVTICITDAVMAELEKLGGRYRLALRVAKDPRFERLPAMREGATYADDDLVERVQAHRIYIVATCDKDLKRRLRKIPGVPIMYIHNHRCSVERLPDATMGNAPKW